MKRYEDYQADKSALYLSPDEMKAVEWTKFTIVVPTEEDRRELMEAFEHIHYANIDTDNIAVNQLAHQYMDDTVADGATNNIIVDLELYNKLNP